MSNITITKTQRSAIMTAICPGNQDMISEGYTSRTLAVLVRNGWAVAVEGGHVVTPEGLRRVGLNDLAESLSARKDERYAVESPNGSVRVFPTKESAVDYAAYVAPEDSWVYRTRLPL